MSHKKDTTSKSTNANQCPDQLQIENKFVTVKKEIDDSFNSYFVNIGKQEASKIPAQDTVSFRDNLISQVEKTFSFIKINEREY